MKETSRLVKIFVCLMALVCCTSASFGQAHHVRVAKRAYAITGEPFVQRVVADSGYQSTPVQLPKGLSWNPARQQIEGTVREVGTYTYIVQTVAATPSPPIESDTIILTVCKKLPQRTPFMGMLTWNVLEDHVSEEHLQLLADAMVDCGLRDAGYTYLCIDDCWALRERDAQGRLVPDPQKFPNGLRAVTKYLHHKRLRAGIYSDAGARTCSGAQPGSLGHEETDAHSFAQWGFDLLKYDFCHSDCTSDTCAIRYYAAMHDALRTHTSDQFIYYICEWGHLKPWLWADAAGGSCWRATDDTRDCWINETYRGGVLDNIRIFTQIWPYTGINHYSDADMLMCGLHGQGRSSNAGTNGQGLSSDEYRTQFILWCMWSSPLTLCFDITTLYDGHSRISDLYNPHFGDDRALVTNTTLIAIDQDPLGQAAEPIRYDSLTLQLLKPLQNGRYALSLTNLSNQTKTFNVNLNSIQGFSTGHFTIQRLNVSTNMLESTTSSTTIHATLDAHATELYILTPQP